MGRIAALLLLAATTSLLATAAEGKKFGKAITVKEETKLADLLAKPEQFNGKRVLVKGTVTWVCSRGRGHIQISSSKKVVSFKVPHGVIVFPDDIKGSRVLVEGVWNCKTLSVEEQISDAKEHKHEIKDPKSLKPKQVMYVDGKEGGVEIQG